MSAHVVTILLSLEGEGPVSDRAVLWAAEQFQRAMLREEMVSTGTGETAVTFHARTVFVAHIQPLMAPPLERPGWAR